MSNTYTYFTRANGENIPAADFNQLQKNIDTVINTSGTGPPALSIADINEQIGDALKVQGIDVAATSPTAGEFIGYNSTTGKYEGKTGAEGATNFSVRCLVHLNGDQTINSGAPTQVLLDTTGTLGFNPFNEWNMTTHEFEPTGITGTATYFFVGSQQYNHIANATYVQSWFGENVFTNNRGTTGGWYGSNAPYWTQNSIVEKMTNSDSMGFFTFHNDAPSEALKGGRFATWVFVLRLE